MLDVGCGPGALTAQLAERLGAGAVSAIDPSGSFVAAARARFLRPMCSPALPSSFPFPDGSFGIALAQLAVHFMTDPVSGLRRWHGSPAPAAWSPPACGTTPEAAVPSPRSGGPCTTLTRVSVTRRSSPAPGRGHLAELCEAAGLDHIEPASLTVKVRFTTLADW